VAKILAGNALVDDALQELEEEAEDAKEEKQVCRLCT